MNFLAHIYLSGNNEMHRIGNFMADHIKGRKYKNYEEEVQKGILLHRQIDSYTDQHAIVRKSKKRLDSKYGLYRGVVIDIFYDHMLAKNWSSYTEVPLPVFAKSFYSDLEKHREILPDKVLYMMKYMIPNDWLSNYAHIYGIERVLIGMNRRTGGESKMDEAILDLNQNYLDIEDDFTMFFEELRSFCTLKMIEIDQDFNK